MTVKVGARTDVGLVRETNQDSYVVLLPPAVADGIDAVLAVADGMGGHSGGEVASQLAAKCLREQFGPAGDGSRLLSHAGLVEAIEGINREVREHAAENPQLQGMGTTLTLGVVARGQLHLGHVGDSRLYLIRDGTVRQISQDHSWVAAQVRAGALTEDQARDHPQRSLLTRAVGGADTIEVDTEILQVEAGDWLVLCSDGLHNLVEPPELIDLIGRAGRPAAAAERLLEVANQRGSPDNVTAVVAQVESVSPGAPEAPRPVTATAAALPPRAEPAPPAEAPPLVTQPLDAIRPPPASPPSPDTAPPVAAPSSDTVLPAPTAPSSDTAPPAAAAPPSSDTLPPAAAASIQPRATDPPPVAAPAAPARGIGPPVIVAGAIVTLIVLAIAAWLIFGGGLR